MKQHQEVELNARDVAETAFAQVSKVYAQSRFQYQILLTTSIVSGALGLMLVFGSVTFALISNSMAISTFSASIIGAFFTVFFTTLFYKMARDVYKQEDKLAGKLYDIERSVKAIDVIEVISSMNIDEENRNRLLKDVVLQLIKTNENGNN